MTIDSQLVLNAFGVVGSISSLLMFIPPAVKIFQYRNDAKALESQSLLFQWMSILSAVCWIVYGFGMNAPLSAVPSFVKIPMACASIFFVVRARREESNGRS